MVGGNYSVNAKCSNSPIYVPPQNIPIKNNVINLSVFRIPNSISIDRNIAFSFSKLINEVCLLKVMLIYLLRVLFLIPEADRHLPPQQNS